MVSNVSNPSTGEEGSEDFGVWDSLGLHSELMTSGSYTASLGQQEQRRKIGERERNK